jgi:uridine kinase
MVDGPAGAGKTTFATGLAAGLGAALAHMDDLYLGWSGLEGGFRRLEKLVLGPWRDGVPARFRAYDWAAGTATGRWIEVAASDCLVVEGCGCAPRRADRYEPVIVWLDGPRDRRWDRVLERDGEAELPQLRDWETATAAHHHRERTAARAHLRLAQ